MSARLMLGDCIEIMKKMESCSIDLVCTDPPYRTVTGGDNGNRPKGMLSGNKKLFEHQNDVSIKDWMPEIYRILKDGSHAYVFTNFLNLCEMMEEARNVGFGLHNLLVWEKNNKTPSQFYMKNCEYILFLRKGKAKYINNIGKSDTVHKFNNIIGTKTHPCEKPVDLLKFYICNSTKEGDMVADPFMGTGSCGVACNEARRDFLGIEKDESFYRVAEQKINNLAFNMEQNSQTPRQEVLF